jgi:hypothetical protein
MDNEISIYKRDFTLSSDWWLVAFINLDLLQAMAFLKEKRLEDCTLVKTDKWRNKNENKIGLIIWW